MRTDGDMVDDDRTYPDIGRLANVAGAGDVRARLNRDVVADFRVMSDERPAIDNDMTANLGVRGKNGTCADDRSFAYRSFR